MTRLLLKMSNWFVLTRSLRAKHAMNVSVNVLPSSQFTTITSIQQIEDTYPAQARTGTTSVCNSTTWTVWQGRDLNSELLANPHTAPDVKWSIFLQYNFSIREDKSKFRPQTALSPVHIIIKGWLTSALLSLQKLWFVDTVLWLCLSQLMKH